MHTVFKTHWDVRFVDFISFELSITWSFLICHPNSSDSELQSHLVQILSAVHVLWLLGLSKSLSTLLWIKDSSPAFLHLKVSRPPDSPRRILFNLIPKSIITLLFMWFHANSLWWIRSDCWWLVKPVSRCYSTFETFKIEAFKIESLVLRVLASIQQRLLPLWCDTTVCVLLNW